MQILWIVPEDTEFLGHHANGWFQTWIFDWNDIGSWEQVLGEGLEEWDIFVDELGTVHIDKNTHEDIRFGLLTSSGLGVTELVTAGSKNRKDVS